MLLGSLFDHVRLLPFSFECLKITMFSSQLIFSLSLYFLTSVYADYVVYPRIRNNLRLNADITDSITSLLGARNVQTFVSRPRAVYEFWLIKATDNQVVLVKGMVGVSVSIPIWNGCGWINYAELPIVG